MMISSSWADITAPEIDTSPSINLGNCLSRAPQIILRATLDHDHRGEGRHHRHEQHVPVPVEGTDEHPLR